MARIPKNRSLRIYSRADGAAYVCGCGAKAAIDVVGGYRLRVYSGACARGHRIRIIWDVDDGVCYSLDARGRRLAANIAVDARAARDLQDELAAYRAANAG